MKMDAMMEEEEPAWNYKLDISQLCRICANPNDYLIPIFQGEGLEHELKNKISKHLPIKVSENDKLPINLCYQCASTLIAWHDMVVGCIEADVRLKALIQDDTNETDSVEQKSTEDSLPLLPPKDGIKTEKTSIGEQITKLTEPEDMVQQTAKNSANKIETEMVVQDGTALEPESLEEEVPSDPRYDEMEADYYSVKDEYEIDGNYNNYIELQDEFMSDFDSDEEFNTRYSCNICNASDMAVGEFLVHTKKHTKEERQLVLEKLVDSKVTEDTAARSAAVAYGFKAQLSVETSVPLYQCTVCGQGNLLLKNLKEHSSLHPKLTDSHFCNLCQQQFDNASGLLTHLETHLDNNDLTCQYCNKRFIIIEDLEQHERTHYQAEYICVVCRESFRSVRLVLMHLKTAHAKSALCQICDKEYKKDNSIDEHFMTHIAISIPKRVVKSFACDFCAKKYDSKISLQRHILFLHNVRTPFVCEYCGFTTYHKDPLNEHMATEHLNNEASMCCQCGIFLNNKSDLDRHMAEHSKQKKYCCKFCGAKFCNPKNLQYHLTSHGIVDGVNVVSKNKKLSFVKEDELDEASEPSFDCKNCGRLFDDEQIYKNHLKYHSGNVLCDLCGKWLDNEVLLSIHLNKVHSGKFCKPSLKSGVFPFKCEKCNYFCRLEFELEAHNKTHKDVLYQCHICFQEFDEDAKLQKHIKSH